MYRFAALLTSLFLSFSAFAEILIPQISDAPKATETFTPDTFDFFAKILGSARLGPHLRCELKAEVRRDVRKFSDRTEWVEYIDITYFTRAGYGGDFHVKIPMNSKFGRKVSNNPWSGVGEDVMIEIGDQDLHWLRFMHDGRGHIVYLMLGDGFRNLPCMVRD